jgi:hypothetical protein
MNRLVLLNCVAVLIACTTPSPGASRHRQGLEIDDADPPAVEAPIAVVGEAGWGGDPTDLDRDGVPVGLDLDDQDELAGATVGEIPCNGLDEDGDLADACPVDADGDGVSSDLDCDDLDGRVSPLAPEIRCNDADENCDGLDDCDRDGDGFLDRSDPAPDDPAVGPPIADADPGQP